MFPWYPYLSWENLKGKYYFKNIVLNRNKHRLFYIQNQKMYSDNLVTVLHILYQFCYLSKHYFTPMCYYLFWKLLTHSGFQERLAEINISYTFILILIKTSLSHWSTIELTGQAFLILVAVLASFIHSFIYSFLSFVCLFFMVIYQSFQGWRIHDTHLVWPGACFLSAHSVKDLTIGICCCHPVMLNISL